MSKRVRFAPVDEHKFWITDNPISTSAPFSNQPLGYCLKCNSVKYTTLNGNNCMNCFIPKPAIKKTITPKDLSSSLLSSKSAENLGSRQRHGNDRSRSSDFLKKNDLFNSHSSIDLQSSKSHEFENINANLYNRYTDSDSNRANDEAIDRWCGIKPRSNGHNSLKKKAWKCEKCEQNLNPGEIAISAEHANPLARWHPKCFSCVECSELLTDLLYYNHNGKIYCQKHYDILTRPKLICAACDLSIESNEYVNAEDHFWHKEHFVCWDCESTLAGKKYIVSDSLPYCLDCHQKSFSKKCNSCNWTIPPDSIRLTYENIDWHASPNCFKCFTCHKNLLEAQFLLKNSILFCSLECKRKVSVI